MLPAGEGFEPLREQLLAAATAFTGDARPLGELLEGLVNDVERATREPLEIFPVCHHSPAAAVHMIGRLRRRPPRVIFMEMCEDLRPLIDLLRDCKLPVALQAFASRTDAFPKSWSPLSVVAPLTAFSAEFQAIAFALENKGTELVFVDRSVDHLFQWMPQDDDALERELQEGAEESEEGSAESPGATSPGEDSDAPSHGSAIGIQIGRIEPTFRLFHDVLLSNARVRHFTEWWEQYVEQPILVGDYATYRHAMFLIGSLFRRLGRRDKDRESDRLRERFMWTRMKDYLAEHRIEPRDALHICGAAHSASEVEEFGTLTDQRWEIPPRSSTEWLYGVIPSSYLAIDQQFHFPPGSVTLASALWEKGQRTLQVKPYTLAKPTGKKKSKGAAAPSEEPSTPLEADSEPTAALEPEELAETTQDDDKPDEPMTPLTTSPDRAEESLTGTALYNYLIHPPAPGVEDQEQLLSWCTGIVALARRDGYLTSTADAIAIYHSSVMLAQLRNRRHPTAYDFRDAAITCLEKDRTPKKRNITRLCDILLGGDRIGQVGFDSMPPLARDVYQRLAPLGVNLQATSLQRALLDIRGNPALLDCSDLLWKIHYLLGPERIVRPIMGEKKLGSKPIQESWDLGIGRNQTPLLMLAYEGVTIEHVLEKRIHKRAFGAEAAAAAALAAAEDALLYLDSDRLAEEIGLHSCALLTRETGAESAREIFERIRRLVHYYRSTPGGLPHWIRNFVTTGYAHYATLLPNAFEDRGTHPDQIAGMLAFIFTLESLALSLGCERSQLVISVKQAGPITDDPNKLGLLWTAEWLLGLRTVDQIREAFDHLLANPMVLDAFPAHVNGLLLSLQFTPLIGPIVVEIMSKAFDRLPAQVLMPWLPGMILMLRQHGETVLPTLLKEAASQLPVQLSELANWQPPWQVSPSAPPASTTATAESPGELSEDEQATIGLLTNYPETLLAVARLVGIETEPPRVNLPSTSATAAQSVQGEGREAEAAALLDRYPETLRALSRRIPR